MRGDIGVDRLDVGHRHSVGQLLRQHLDQQLLLLPFALGGKFGGLVDPHRLRRLDQQGAVDQLGQDRLAIGETIDARRRIGQLGIQRLGRDRLSVDLGHPLPLGLGLASRQGQQGKGDGAPGPMFHAKNSMTTYRTRPQADFG